MASYRKGKSMEEIYGSEKAEKMKISISKKIKDLWKNKIYRNHMIDVHTKYNSILDETSIRNDYRNGLSIMQISKKYNTCTNQISDMIQDIVRNKGFQKQHKINIGRKCDEIKKKKIGNAQLGKIISKKTRKLMSIAQSGRTVSEKTRQKISKAKKGKIPYTMTDETREKFRVNAIKRIEKQYGLEIDGLCPTIGKQETPMLDALEKCFGYKIERQYKVNGYFLDGYCSALNLAIEIDENHHKGEEQMSKDIYRENIIKNELQCNFIRIDVGDTQ